jgi:hypothetical protein
MSTSACARRPRETGRNDIRGKRASRHGGSIHDFAHPPTGTRARQRACGPCDDHLRSCAAFGPPSRPRAERGNRHSRCGPGRARRPTKCRVCRRSTADPISARRVIQRITRWAISERVLLPWSTFPSLPAGIAISMDRSGLSFVLAGWVIAGMRPHVLFTEA